MSARIAYVFLTLAMLLAGGLRGQSCAQPGDSNVLSGRAEVVLYTAGERVYPHASQIAEAGQFWNNACGGMWSGWNFPRFRYSEEFEPGSIRVEYQKGPKDELNPACNCYPRAEWFANQALVVIYGQWALPGSDWLIPNDLEQDGIHMIAHELGHALGLDDYQGSECMSSNSIMAGASGFRLATEADCEVANQQNLTPAEEGPSTGEPMGIEYQDICDSYFEYCGEFWDPWWTGPARDWGCTQRWEQVTTTWDSDGDGVDDQSETTYQLVMVCGDAVDGGKGMASYTGPTLSVARPKGGATVRGRTPVSGWAVDRDSVGEVSAWLDGVRIDFAELRLGEPSPGACQTVGGPSPFCNGMSGFSGVLDFTTVTPGQHRLQILVMDQLTDAPMPTAVGATITVEGCDGTMPQPSIASPQAGAAVQGVVQVTTGAGLPSWVQRAQLEVNGSILAVDSQQPFAFSWNTQSWSDGTHVLRLRAFDGCGNARLSAPVQVDVDNDAAPPQATVNAPAAGSLVRGLLTVSALATDDTGVTRVEFYIDGVLGSTDSAAPYSFAWNTLAAADGAHTLTAKAYDQAGNIGVSPPVAIRVDNTSPRMWVESPAAGALVWGSSSRIGGWATDANRVTTLSFEVDGQPLSLNGPYSYGGWRSDVCNVHPGDPNCPAVGWEAYFNSIALANGTHSLQVVATDGVGLTSAMSVSFAVDNRPFSSPAMHIDYPLEGVSVSGTAVNLEGWALDAQGIASLVFEIDSTPLVLNGPYLVVSRADACAAYNYVDQACPNVGWRAAFDSQRYADGLHTLSVVATDRRGEQSRFNRSIRIANAPGSAQTRFPIAADAYIVQDMQTSNFGMGQTLLVRGYDSSEATKYAFLKFHVSGLTSGVGSARLRIRTGSSVIGALKVYNVFSSDWSEATLTWANAPWSSSFLMWAYNLPPYAWHELDVTSIVTGNGSFTIGLGSADVVDGDVYSAQSSYPAELVVYH